VSTCKNARSAHVEILKVEIRDEGRKERRGPEHLITTHVWVYFYTLSTCLGFSNPLSSPRLVHRCPETGVPVGSIFVHAGSVWNLQSS